MHFSINDFYPTIITDLYPSYIYPHSPNKDLFTYNLVCTWKHQSVFKSFLDNSIEILKSEIFFRKYGAISKCELGYPIGPIGNRIYKILKIESLRAELRTSNFQLSFDAGNNPSLVKFDPDSLASFQEKFIFYMGYHLDKIYRSVEVIFKKHAEIVSDFEEDIPLSPPSLKIPNEWAETLKNNLLRLKNIEKEQELIFAALNSILKTYDGFCSKLSYSERFSFYASSSFESFKLVHMNLVRLPLNATSYALKIHPYLPKPVCCPPPCPPLFFDRDLY